MSIFDKPSANGGSPVLMVAGYSVLALGIVTLVWSIGHHGGSSGSKPRSSIASNAVDNSPSIPVNNFYDCLDSLKKTPSNTDVCTANGKDYNRPTSFSEDSIRGLSKVPSSAKAIVVSLAKQRFASCESSHPTSVATTGIIGANQHLVYQSSNCDTSQKSLLVDDSGTWKEVSLPGNTLSCSVADTYHVPAAVISDKSAKTPGSAPNCIDANGQQRALLN